jgi:predicted MFS family arabinose efflux permease
MSLQNVREPLDAGRRTGRLLVLNSFIIAAGSGLFLAGSAIYYTRVVGLSVTQLGAGLSIAGGVGLFASLPVGVIADRIGAGRMLTLLHLCRAVLFLVVIAVDGFWFFLTVVSAIAVADRSVRPVNQAMVGDLLGGQDRVRTMTRVRAASNTGLAVGSAVAGLLLASPSASTFRVIILGNASTFLVAAYVTRKLSRLVRETELPGPGGSDLPVIGGGLGGPLRDRRFLFFMVANGVLALHNSLLFIALPLWIIRATSAPIAMVSVCLAVNTVLTAVGQTWWAGIVSDARRASLAFVATGMLLAACCAILAGTRYTGAVVACVLLLIGIVALTTGENMQSVASWQISFAYPPKARRSTYLSVFNIGLSGETMIGPIVVTGLAVSGGPLGWGALGCVFAVAGLACAWSGRALTTDRPLPVG